MPLIQRIIVTLPPKYPLHNQQMMTNPVKRSEAAVRRGGGGVNLPHFKQDLIGILNCRYLELQVRDTTYLNCTKCSRHHLLTTIVIGVIRVWGFGYAGKIHRLTLMN